MISATHIHPLMDEATPRALRETPYSLLGKMQGQQRRLFMFIAGRSAQGLWTSYDDAECEGIHAPSKRMSEIRPIVGHLIRTRTLGRKVVEFCIGEHHDRKEKGTRKKEGRR